VISIATLAVLGVVVAAGIGLLTNAIAGDSIGLSASPLQPGKELAPPAARKQPAEDHPTHHRHDRAEHRGQTTTQATSTTTTTPTTTPTTTVPTTTTGELEPDDNSGSSGSSGPGSGDSGSSGSGSSGSGSSGSSGPGGGLDD
jgi:uncharacterized membrane protein YgcG